MSSPFKFKQFSVYHEKSTLKVGTDAMLLGSWIKANGQKILEAGTGCGVIALMLAQKCKAHITGIDIDKASIEEANTNIRNSPWATRMEMVHISLQELAKNHSEKFDHIISNPPFFSNSLRPDNQNKAVSKHTDFLDFETLLHCSASLLSDTGKLSIIIPFNEQQNLIQLATIEGLFPEHICKVIPKANKKPNRSMITFGKEKIESFSTDITIRNNDNSYSEAYKKLTNEYHRD